MKRRFLCILSAFLLGTTLCAGMISADEATESQENTGLLLPSQGDQTEGNELITIDTSNLSEGYVMMEYLGTADSVVLQVTIPDNSATYTYPVLSGWQTFPLTCGSGTYSFNVLEHLYDDFYAVAYSTALDVQLADELRPYLYPNEYVNYNESSTLVGIAADLLAESENKLNFVENVYNYVITNIAYDDEKAESNLTYYVPDLEETLSTGKGICFDYASLMAAMLRSSGVPTKLVFGYSGTVYHAWISVYLDEYGWVDGIIEFDGISWTLMDPTLGANNDSQSVGQYIGDGSNYTEKYWY